MRGVILKIMQQDSIFTKIIKGEIPAHKVYEDDRIIAFLDIHPINPGHTLVVPKKQIDYLWDLEDDDYQYLWKITKQLAQKIQDTLQPPRVGVIVEGFGVPHAHIHLIPLEHGNDIKKHQDLEAEPDHKALQAVAAKLQ
jgi:histidine triad (HIT) family protein